MPGAAPATVARVTRDPRDVLDRPARRGDEVILYGDHPDQVVEVWRPAVESGPPIVFLHGGFWRAAYDRRHCAPLAEDLAGLGYPVGLVEYRRSGRGGWTAMLDDVTTGIEAATRVLGRAVLGGHSAGGHLALWYAARAPERVRGVVALAPVADLALAYDLGLGDGAVADLLGGGPQERARAYAGAQPGAIAAPARILHGTDDVPVPVAVSRTYATRTGTPLTELRGVDHFALIDPLSEAWSTVIATFALLAADDAV
jgi:acetyl esterase/lipase